MSVESSPFLAAEYFNTFLFYSLLVLLIFYAIFAVIIVRQVDLMSKTLVTPLNPLVKAVAILHAGFAVGFVVLLFGVLR